jgi:hypothetical protein
MSTSNIISIEPVLAGEIPVGVEVTFRTKKGTRTYLYNALSAVTAILQGEDPIRFGGILIEQNEI